MDYPFWDVGIGYGVLMGVIAILHVFVSHFAIGGGLYLVVAEISARKAADVDRLSYLQRLTKFFVLVTLVLGALTGVGIWFIIGLLNPAATAALIHNFVWGWAIEWTFFIVEICAALVYFYGWKAMSPRNHITVGWVYFSAAWLSLVVINGIIDFMLTPGKWLATGDFWSAFFNPTYWPSLVFRTGICLLLAGVFTMAVASRVRDLDLKGRLIRYNAFWTLAGLVVIVPSGYWYWRAVPSAVTTQVAEMMPTPVASAIAAIWFLAGLTLLTLIFGLAAPRRMPTAVAVLVMALALGFFGGFEWMRESIRKPYAIHGYMYGNGVELAKADLYARDGYLPHVSFRTGDDGADLFRHACRSCHTVNGYKPLKPAFDGTDREFIAGVILGADLLRANMPPFLGSQAEAAMIADHLWPKVDQRHLSEIYGLSGVELGEKVFETRCGLCHDFGGYRDNRESLIGLEEDDYNDILDNGGDYGERMPSFSGDEAERSALIAYFRTLGEEGGM